MAATGISYATASTADVSGTVWSNRANAHGAPDGVYATSSPSNTTTRTITFTGFATGIPPYSTPTAIRVAITRHAANTDNPATDAVIKLAPDGTAAGDNKASGTAYGLSDSTPAYSGDFTAAYWNTGAITADQIGAGVFGIVYQGQDTGANTIYLDAIGITVTYTGSTDACYSGDGGWIGDPTASAQYYGGG